MNKIYNLAFNLMNWLIDRSVDIKKRDQGKQIAKKLGGLFYKTIFHSQYKQETKTIQKVLNINQKQAKKIAELGYQNLCSFLADYYAFGNMPTKEINAITASVDIEGQEFINDVLTSKRPIVITSIHMDSFLIGFLKLCEFAPQNRPVTIIKYRHAREKETQAYQRFSDLGLSFKVLRLSERPGIETFQALRSGNILFVLCDVDPDWGKTVPITFFEKSARFSCGPIELAIASNAWIVPVVSFQTAEQPERHTLRIEKPIDTQLYPTLNFKEKTQILTKELVKLVQNWVQDHPEQWQSWGIVEELCK